MKIQDLINDGKVDFYANYLENSLKDKITGNDPTVSTSTQYSNHSIGRGIYRDIYGGASGDISYSALSEARPDKTVFILWANGASSRSGLQEIFGTASSGDTFLLLLSNGVFGVYSYGSPTGGKYTSHLIDDENPHAFAVRYRSGVTNGTTLFVDGVNYLDTSTGAQSSTPASFGFKSNDPNSHMGGTAFVGLIVNQLLTNQEIAEISEELLAMRGTLKVSTRGVINHAPEISENCIFAIDSDRYNENSLFDLSGNDNYMTIGGSQKGIIHEKTVSNLTALKSMDSAYLSIVSGSLDLGTQHTFECVLEDIADNQMITARAVAGGYLLYYNASHVRYHNNSVFVDWTVGDLSYGEHHFICQRDGTSVRLWVDGIDYGTKTLANNTSMNIRYLFGSLKFTGKHAYLYIYSDLKSEDWVAERYRNHAKHVHYLHTFKDCPPTLANVSGATVKMKIGESDFTTTWGTWQIPEDDILKSVTAGYAHTSSDMVEGTWVWDFLHGDATYSATYFSFIADTFGAYSGQKGYMIYTWSDGSFGVLKITGGGSVGIITSSAGIIESGKKIRFFVTRAHGVFKLYYQKEGGDVTYVGTATDTTYKTSNLFCMSAGRGNEELSNLMMLDGALSINDLPTL